MEEFFINYLSSVLAGLTLGFLGFGIYKIFLNKKSKNIIKQKLKQFNKKGQNINININSTETTKVAKEILKGIIKNN